MITLSKAISLKLIKLLSERNMTQYELCKLGGIPRTTINDVFNNRKKRVSVETIYQICSTLGITLSEFFEDELFIDISN